MRTLFALLCALLLIPSVSAEELMLPKSLGCGSPTMLLHTMSYHGQTDTKLTGENGGVGFQCQDSRTQLKYAVGGFRNGNGDTSLYLGTARDWKAARRIELGGMVGIVTGYAHHESPVLFIGAGRLGFVINKEQTLRFSLIPHTRYNPRTIHLTIEGKF